LATIGVGLVFLLMGGIILAATAFRWGWFADHWKAKRAYAILGRTGGIVFYSILGVVFVIIGVLVMWGIIAPE
jgi:hypothetical protein